MNQQEINKRIATVCGWQVHPKDKWVVIPPNSPHSVQPISTIPDYYNDLNAMHEAENTLNGSQWNAYVIFIAEKPPQPHGWLLAATAAQRAEAFLRTINQWEESK